MTRIPDVFIRVQDNGLPKTDEVFFHKKEAAEEMAAAAVTVGFMVPGAKRVGKLKGVEAEVILDWEVSRTR